MKVFDVLVSFFKLMKDIGPIIRKFFIKFSNILVRFWPFFVSSFSQLIKDKIKKKEKNMHTEKIKMRQ